MALIFEDFSDDEPIILTSTEKQDTKKVKEDAEDEQK